jgi:hypothetical protein
MGSLTLHTDIPTRSEIQRLLLARDPCCVSAYLSTSPITQAAQADRIELKNLVSDASGQLEAAGAGRAAVSDVRESLDALVEYDDFWPSKPAASPCSPRRRACARSGCRIG